MNGFINAFFNLNILINIVLVNGDKDARRLIDDLLKTYDSIVRPVTQPNDQIKLYLGIKLSQIADIDERNQIMTTNVWVRHEWHDHKLMWNPDNYGNITKIKIPSSKIWLADVVLYNNADGDYQITTKTKVTVYYNGKIVWEPAMIYKSYCAIDIEYYPFDIQHCYMKFGTWTFDGNLIDLEHIGVNNSIPETNPVVSQGGISTKLYTVLNGIDLSDYYESVEWDILSIPAQKNIKYYDCCMEPFYDIYFNITIRRKTLFYTVNLIIPCVNISFLSVLVFYLPSSSGEKIALGIYVLVALLVFYLLMIELIPPTSLVIPLLGKYLLFTLILVNVSILLTIFVLNLHHRKPSTHIMPTWMRRVFIDTLPKYLFIERPKHIEDHFLKSINLPNLNRIRHLSDESISKLIEFREQRNRNPIDVQNQQKYPENIRNAMRGISYMNLKLKQNVHEKKEIDDWKYIAMVIDRILLWAFSFAFFFGTFGILLRAPSIYDDRAPYGK